MMKRFFSVLVIAALAIFVTAGGAWASAIGDDVPVSAGDPITVAAEAIGNNYTINLDPNVDSPLGNPVGKTIYYQTTIALNTGDKLTFQLTNGKFMDGNYFLLFEEGKQDMGNGVDTYDLNGDNDTYDIVEAGNLISSTDTVNGVTSITIRIAGQDLPANSTLILVASNAQVGDNSSATTYNPTDNITVMIDNAVTDGDAVTIQVVDAEDVGGTPLDGAETTAETIINAEWQFAVTLTPATSMIDVEQNRTLFVDETSNNTVLTTTNDTDTRRSAALLTIDNDEDNTIEDFITLDNNDTYTLTLTPSTDFTGVNFAADDYGVYYEIENKGTNNDADVDFTQSGNNATATIAGDTANFANPGDTNADDLVISNTGSTILETRTFSLVVELNLKDEPRDRTWNLGTSHSWTVNAMQARLPYIIVESGGSNYTSFIEITNRGDTDANLSIDAVISNENGTANDTETVNNVTTIPANSVVIIKESDLDNWLTKVDDTQLYRLGLTLTVVAAQNSVDISAYQKDPIGRTEIPVLYNTNNTNDGRVWQ